MYNATARREVSWRLATRGFVAYSRAGKLNY
jgi:hypothetical protein